MSVRTGFNKVTLGLLGPLEERPDQPQPSAVLSEIRSPFSSWEMHSPESGNPQSTDGRQVRGHAHPVCYPLEGDHGYRCGHMSPSCPTELLPSVVAWWAVGFGERCLWGNGGGGRGADVRLSCPELQVSVHPLGEGSTWCELLEPMNLKCFTCFSAFVKFWGLFSLFEKPLKFLSKTLQC